MIEELELTFTKVFEIATTHEYVLAFYGVICWQLAEFFGTKKTWRSYWKTETRETLRSLIWIGILIAFDDELLSWYNHFTWHDKQETFPAMYFVGGFFIDYFRIKFSNFNKSTNEKPD